MSLQSLELSTPGWPTFKVVMLRKLVAERLSAREIAAELDATRSAVIGKCHRLGLLLARHKGGQPGSGGTRRRPRRTPRTQVAPTFDAFVIPEGEQTVSVLELNDHNCHWPYGDSTPHVFCGKPSEKNLPYCPQHCDLAYGPGLIPEADRIEARMRGQRFGRKSL